MKARHLINHLQRIQRQIAAGRALAAAGQLADADAVLEDAEQGAKETAASMGRGIATNRAEATERFALRALSSLSPQAETPSTTNAGDSHSINP